MRRVIPVNRIPQSLWKGSIVYFPNTLTRIYDDTLSKYSLITQAKVFVRGVVGGVSSSEAEAHFAQRYLTSSSRVEFAFLDPLDRWEDIHNILNEILSEGEIGLLDLACGGGAATCGLITTLIELREKRVLPLLPISIHVVGADYSQRSLDIFKEQLGPLVNTGRQWGVDITSDLLICDLTNATDITTVLNRLTGTKSDDYLVLIANISSALENDEFRDNLDRVMTLIFGFLNGKRANIISIEPSESRSEQKGWFRKILERALSFFGDWAPTHTSASNAQYEYFHHLLNQNVRSNVSIKEVRHGE